MSYRASHADLYDLPPDAMRLPVDAVELLGGLGCVNDYPPQGMMRDAKITQIYWETRIQRVVIGQALAC